MKVQVQICEKHILKCRAAPNSISLFIDFWDNLVNFQYMWLSQRRSQVIQKHNKKI